MARRGRIGRTVGHLTAARGLLLVLLPLLAGCPGSVPGAGSFGTGDAGDATDGAGLLADAAADTTADTAQQTDAPTADTGDADAKPGPSCGQALTCLVEKKQQLGGLATGGCKDGLATAEADQIDQLLACTDAQCVTTFDAWADGGGDGDGELTALYACLVEKCPVPLSICIGGHGDATCAHALKCMLACAPTDRDCTMPCLAPTTEAQSAKAGAFLACVFGKCPLAELATCSIPLSCGLKCPELAP